MVLFVMKGTNPFGMIGSYVGLFVGLIGAYFSFVYVLHLAEIGKLNFFGLLIPLVSIVVGFWIGWGIQVLIEKK